MDHLSTFHLNRTVNELGNVVLRKLREPEKLVVPSAKNQTTGARASRFPLTLQIQAKTQNSKNKL